MLVTKDNYKIGERVILTQSGIDHWTLNNHLIIKIFESSDIYLSGEPRYYMSSLKEFSWWCTVKPMTTKDGPHLSMCISELTIYDTPGFFLEYPSTYDLKTILKNLDRIGGKL